MTSVWNKQYNGPVLTGFQLSHFRPFTGQSFWQRTLLRHLSARLIPLFSPSGLEWRLLRQASRPFSAAMQLQNGLRMMSEKHPEFPQDTRQPALLAFFFLALIVCKYVFGLLVCFLQLESRVAP